MRRPALALLAAALVGCGAHEASTPKVSTASAEGLCAEHGVLESVCTKCNPALIPIFKDKGDWCEEHGFPESFCPICHPERGGRPAADVSVPAPPAEAEPADGTTVRFKSKDSAELAGIEVVEAMVDDAGPGLLLPGTIVPDATRVAAVNARADGVLQRVLVEVGARVKPGETLAVITSASAGAARGELAAAEARARAAKADYEREQALHDKKITSEQDLVAARRALEEADASVASARAEVGVLGGVGAAGTFELRAPREGVVIERHGTAGELVGADETLFTIVDPRVVWLELDVPERLLDSVGVGAEIAMEGPRVAKVESLSPVLDPHTRTALARASLDNADGKLRIHSRVRARVLAGGGSTISVPSTAVQRIGERDVVFVRTADDAFELRHVVVKARSGGWAFVSDGLAAGAPVATTGSFLLRTEVQKASIGSGCCEVD